MPPAIDIHSRPVTAGDEWVWLSSAPQQDLSGGVSLEWDAGSLTAVDRDEEFVLVPWTASATAVVAVRKGYGGVEIAAPVRWVPNRELGLGGVRLSLLGVWEDVGITSRLTMVDDGELGWGSAWSSSRVEGSLAWGAGVLGVEAAGSWGEDGWGARASAGAHLPGGFDIEAAWTRVWSSVPAGTAELGVGRLIPVGAVSVRPFVSAGIGSTPGTPTVRLVVDVRAGNRSAVTEAPNAHPEDVLSMSEPPPPPVAQQPEQLREGPTLPPVVEETQSIVEEEEEEGELQDCGLVPGETYRIGINQLQLPDGRVISNWRMCQLQEGIRFSVQYEESTPEASVEPDPQADKTPTPPAQVQPALDSSPQAAAVGRMGAFLAKHPEVILLEARVTASCLVDGSADPIGRSAAEDLVARVSTLGVEAGRISVREMPCSAGTRSVRIEAVVVRAQPVNDAPKQ